MHNFAPVLLNGLRDYSSPPTIWAGDNDCSHEWIEQVTPAANGLVNNDMQGETLSGNSATRGPRRSDFCRTCGAWKGCLGLEPTPQLFVRNLTEIFLEVRRVLKKNGTLWLNLGDSYAGSGRGLNGDGTHSAEGTNAKQSTNRGSLDVGRAINENSFSKKLIENRAIGNAWVKPPAGFKQKDLMGMPWRVAFALQDSGWWLRQDIIWHKPNPMPESVTDRCTKAHEYIFLLTKSAKYYFDQDAIREPLKDASLDRVNWKSPDGWDTTKGEGGHGSFHKNGREKGSVKFGGNNRCPDTRLQSGKEWTPKGRDRSNGNRNGEGASTLDIKGYEHRGTGDQKLTGHSGSFDADGNLIGDGTANKKSVWTVTTQPFKASHFATFPEKLIEPCILAGSREGDLILDPFSGAGTTLLVALKNKRKGIGIELNEAYIEISKKRLADLQVRLF